MELELALVGAASEMSLFTLTPVDEWGER